MSTPGSDSIVQTRARLTTARILAWFFAVVAAVLMMGLIDLGTVFGLSDARYEWQVPIEASWGSLFTFVIAGSLGWIGARPTRPWPGLVLLGLTVGAVALAGLLLTDSATLWLGAGLAVATGAVFLLLRPGRLPARLGPSPAPVVTVAYAAGALLWLGYAWISYADARAGVPGDVTNGIDHWPVQVALGLALAAACGWAVVRRESPVLWRVAFALTGAIVAYATLAYPDRGGAMPHWLWGVAMAVWAVVLLVPMRSAAPKPADQPVG